MTHSKFSKNTEPFKFSLIIGFKLSEENLSISYKIINKDSREIFFAIVSHPYFACPLDHICNFNDYFIEFTHDSYSQRLFTERVLNSGETAKFKLENKKLNLFHEMFDNDAIFLETIDEKDELKLASNLKQNYIKVSYCNMTTVGFWHTNKTDAPFICIEPGAGFPGHDFVIEDIEQMLDMNKLGVGKKYQNTYNIEFHIEK